MKTWKLLLSIQLAGRFIMQYLLYFPRFLYTMWVVFLHDMRKFFQELMWDYPPNIIEVLFISLHSSIGVGLLSIGTLEGPVYRELTSVISTHTAAGSFIFISILQGVVFLYGPYWIRRTYVSFIGSLWSAFTVYYLVTPAHRIGAFTCAVFAIWALWAWLRLSTLQKLKEARIHGRTRSSDRPQSLVSCMRSPFVPSAAEGSRVLVQTSGGSTPVSSGIDNCVSERSGEEVIGDFWIIGTGKALRGGKGTAPVNNSRVV